MIAIASVGRRVDGCGVFRVWCSVIRVVIPMGGAGRRLLVILNSFYRD